MNNASAVGTGVSAVVYPNVLSNQQPSQSGTISGIGLAALDEASSSMGQSIAGRDIIPLQQAGASLSPTADESASVASASQSTILRAEIHNEKGEHQQAVGVLTSVQDTDPLLNAKALFAEGRYSDAETAADRVAEPCSHDKGAEENRTPARRSPSTVSYMSFPFQSDGSRQRTAKLMIWINPNRAEKRGGN